MFFWCSETNETDLRDHFWVCPTPNKRSEDEQRCFWCLHFGSSYWIMIRFYHWLITSSELPVLQALCLWFPSPFSPMNVTAPWLRPPLPAAESTARRWEGSASPGSTPWPGPYRRCWAGANTGLRVPAPLARWIGKPRRPITSPTSSACSPSAWFCHSASSSTPTASCCTPSDRWDSAETQWWKCLWGRQMQIWDMAPDRKSIY